MHNREHRPPLSSTSAGYGTGEGEQKEIQALANSILGTQTNDAIINRANETKCLTEGPEEAEGL